MQSTCLESVLKYCQMPYTIPAGGMSWVKPETQAGHKVLTRPITQTRSVLTTNQRVRSQRFNRSPCPFNTRGFSKDTDLQPRGTPVYSRPFQVQFSDYLEKGGNRLARNQHVDQHGVNACLCSSLP